MVEAAGVEATGEIRVIARHPVNIEESSRHFFADVNQSESRRKNSVMNCQELFQPSPRQLLHLTLTTHQRL
jgi:hypothetical protein